MNKKPTAKERVLKKYPKAWAKYSERGRKFIIINDCDSDLSGYYSRERDAWASAARLDELHGSTFDEYLLEIKRMADDLKARFKARPEAKD